MSDFVKHVSCPNCGSKDNRAIYSDGHEYCFGCQDFTKGNGFKKIEQLKNKKNKNANSVNLPDDIIFTVPEIARAWHNKYGITATETWMFRFGWSEEMKMLIIPIYNENQELLAWQGKVFDINSGMKYYSRGPLEDVDYILKHDSETKSIVVVEDMLSAIKVNRHTTVLPLFGSNLSTKRLERLSKKFDKIVVWLDRDKAKYGVSIHKEARLVFESSRMIIKDKDPKCYSDDIIEKELSRSI